MVNIIELDNFEKVDLSELTLPLIVVYEKPRDYPDKYVARIWDIDKPTNVVVLKDSLEEIRKVIPSFLNRINKSPDDDKCIVETYI